MKSNSLPSAVGCVLASVLVVPALLAVEPGAPRDSVFVAQDVSLFAASVSYENQDRPVDSLSGWKLESESWYGCLSVDPYIRWLTLTVGGGYTQVKPATRAGYDKWGSAWLAGVKANVWEYSVKDPDFLLSRVQIQASGVYAAHDSDLGPLDIKWDEWRAALTINGQFFAEELGADAAQQPYATTVFAGPVYSVVNRDQPHYALDTPGGEYEFGSTANWGFLLGFDVYVAHNVSVGWDARTYDGFQNWTHNLHTAVHF